MASEQNKSNAEIHMERIWELMRECVVSNTHNRAHGQHLVSLMENHHHFSKEEFAIEYNEQSEGSC